LEYAELSLIGWVNIGAFVFPKHLFAQFVDPQDRDRDGQQQMVEPLWVAQVRVMQVEATRLLIAEALLNGMIANDKFCCTRHATLTLSWRRGPRRR